MKLTQLAKVCMLGLGVSSVALFAQAEVSTQQSKLDNVVEAGKEINTSASNSQDRINKMNDQIIDKLGQFKAVNKEIDGLKVYNSQMQTQLDHQLTELEQLAVSIEQVSVIERQISPLMQRMIETLESFVALDVPFLPEERANRINGLNEMLLRADIAVSEKFRRVLEAYQVEVDYGRTIEAYTGLLDVNGQSRDVDFLRIGRVSLIYQTRDGKQLGIWNTESKSWTELDQSYRTPVAKALRIARKQLAPDLMTVPVKAAG